MKDNFSCSLTGKMWWKPFLVFIVLFLAVFIPLEFALAKLQLPGSTTNVPATVLFIVVMYALIFIIEAIFSVILLRIAYPAVSVRNKPFVFTGSISEFVKIYIIGFLLSLITIGIFIPWFAKKITDYIVTHSEYDGEKAVFLGKGGTLFKYILLALVLPLIVWIIIFTGLIVLLISGGSSPATTFITCIVFIFLFIIIVPFMYLAYKWYFNISWKGIHISLKSSFWPSCFFILGQIALLLITIGIYWPAFFIKLYRYFIGKTTLSENDKEISRLGFEGKTGKGFGLLWGQALLSLITLGIFLPWAYANCARYFINNTYVDDAQEMIGQK